MGDSHTDMKPASGPGGLVMAEDLASETASHAPLGRQFEAILEAMADGVWVCDTTPRLLWINSACEQLNDIRRKDVCGRTVGELLDRGNFDTDVTHRKIEERRRAPAARCVSGISSPSTACSFSAWHVW